MSSPRAPRPAPAPPRVVLDVADGSNCTGQEILAAASILSRSQGIRLRFTTPDGGQGAISTSGRKPEYGDRMSLQVSGEVLFVNDEGPVSVGAVRDRLRIYVEAARLAATRPILVVFCSPETTGPDLVRVLAILGRFEVIDIALPDHRWIFAPGTPEPPKELHRSFHHFTDPVRIR